MKNQKKNPLRIVWLFCGFLAMGIGAVGVVLPVLPTTPFLLLASFCLAKGSERFHRWFTGTKLYKKHLEGFVKNRSMTLKTKFSLLIPASCMLILACVRQGVHRLSDRFQVCILLHEDTHCPGRREHPAGDGRIETMKETEKKRRKEQYVVEEMIRLYCRKNHEGYERKTGRMCPVCQELTEYARLRSEKCPFMENKTFCSNCRIHCYKPEMREKIRQVMRFSGPRMLLYHPVLAVWHVACSVREKKKQKLKGVV